MTLTPLPPALTELETRLGLPADSLEDVELKRAEAALKDASALVLAEAPPAVAERWRSEAPEVVTLVVLTAARRGFENPRGINQETLGAHTVGLSDSTGVYLTARELAQVRRAATGRRTGFVGTIRTPTAYGIDEGDDTLYVPVTGSRPVAWLSTADIYSGV